MKRRHLVGTLLVAALAVSSATFAADTKPLKGNPTSKIVHTSSCKHYTSKGATKEFPNKAAAMKAGYKSCKKCGTDKPAPKK